MVKWSYLSLIGANGIQYLLLNRNFPGFLTDLRDAGFKCNNARSAILSALCELETFKEFLWTFGYRAHIQIFVGKQSEK